MPKARLHFEGDNTGIEKEARLYSLTQEVEDKLDSISSIETTLQGEIDDLQDQINQVASRGRYLTTWDCTTGLPDTNPTTDPYTYRPGDYYIVGTVGGTNYRPHGSEYHVGVASQTLETQAVSVNDLYIYDGTQWTLQRTGASVYAVWGSITGNLQAQTDLQNALNDKANRTDVLEKTNTTSYTPTADYHPSTKKYSDDNDTYIGTSAPTNNVVEGRLWYDTAADVLKVYNGSQWVPTGKTYTAGSHIEISNADVISTKGLQEELTAGNNITIEDVCTTESDMKGPCPKGFHIPLKSEWDAVVSIMKTTFGLSGYLAYFKMPAPGYINHNGQIVNPGTSGFYHCSNASSGSEAYCLQHSAGSSIMTITLLKGEAISIRAFKNTPVIPNSAWVTLYDGSSVAAGAGVFHNAELGLISISGDGINRITIADKNVGATAVWNNGDTLDGTNRGRYYQWGNNYGFPWGNPTTTSSTQVDATGYGPGNYYSSDVFNTAGLWWDSSNNQNLRGGVTQGTWQDCDLTISAEDTTYTAGPGIAISANNVISNTSTSAEWGNITGTLSDQTDLQDALDEKQDVLTPGDNITIEDICTTESDMKGPAPDGFHVPLNTERQAVYDIRTALGGGSTDGANFGIALKLPLAGNRSDSSSIVFFQGTYGSYRSSSRKSEYSARFLRNSSTAINPYGYNNRASGFSIRCFKNFPVVPTSSWTKLYGTSIEVGGIFWSSTDGLISLSSDGQTWITITDKNLGATTVWNSGDTLSEANCGKFYQRGNNYGFPRTGSVTTSSTQVDASVYGPGNYYSSNTFILNTGRWDTTDNGNLWGGVTQGTWQDCDYNVISATVPEAPNTKTFIVDPTVFLPDIQDAYDWYAAGNNPILLYRDETYYLESVSSGSPTMMYFRGKFISGATSNSSGTQLTGHLIYVEVTNGSVTDVTFSTNAEVGGKFLATDINYPTPYTPQYNGSPATKKYVDEHGANIPVYYYLGDFNNDITFNIIEAGVYRLYVRAYHGTTVDKTLTLTVDGVAVGALTSNLIEHLNASINFTASAGSTAVLSVSSKTNFTIQEVYIEKVNIQSGYLTATVN